MKRRLAYIILALLLLAMGSMPARAELVPMGDNELSSISARSGIDLGIADLRVYGNFGTFRYTASDGGYIEFGNFSLTDGQGGPILIRTGDVDTNGDGLEQPFTFDAFTVSDTSSPIYGKSMMVFKAPDWLQQVDLSADHVIFCDQDLGKMELGIIHKPSFALYLSDHQASGVDFEYDAALNMDKFTYTYNTVPETLELQGIHFAEATTGAPDDPSSWAFTGNFQVGDLFNANPATFDVGSFTDPDTGEQLAAIAMNLPMRGTIRVENVHFGTRDFGPCAIDGIQVHRLHVLLVP